MFELTRIGIRILRAALKTYIDAGSVIAIGDHYNLRAFLVPVPKHEKWDAKSRRKAIREAEANFKKIIRAELGDA